MSLLMDALRKAEQQKQKGRGPAEGSQADSVPGLSLEPLPPKPATDTPPEVSAAPRPEQTRLPELPAHLEDLDEQFMAHAAQATPKSQIAAGNRPTSPLPVAPSPTAPAPAAEKRPEPTPEMARKMFEAKQPAPGNTRKLALVAGLLGLLATIGIGGYVWWEIQPKSGLAGTASSARVTAAPQPAPVAPPAATTSPPGDAAAPTQVATVSPAPTSVAAATKPVIAAAPEQEDMPVAKAPPAPRRERPPAAAATELPVKLTASAQKTDPSLDQAYQAFNSGDLAQAQALWQKTLDKEPRSADALHGLAALALRQQRLDLAAEYYLRALENDPKDARALSGLYALRPPSDSMQAESRLKLLLAEQPDSAHLNLALGTLLAREQRWAEAQQAYFRAHSADPANPDHLFNLAVSLDQLRQKRLAAQYYGKALDAAARQPAAFDAAQANARLRDLQAFMQ